MSSRISSRNHAATSNCSSAAAFKLEHEALAKLQKIGVKIVKDVDKSGFQEVSRPIQDKLATDLGPNAVKVLGLVRNLK